METQPAQLNDFKIRLIGIPLLSVIIAFALLSLGTVFQKSWSSLSSIHCSFGRVIGSFSSFRDKSFGIITKPGSG